MDLLITTVISIVGYIILLLITTNLTGTVVRGFLSNRRLQEPGISDATNTIVTFLFAIIGLLFLIALFYFLNIWAPIAALMLMISRVPDLMWEVRTGRKVSTKETPKGTLNIVTLILTWVSPIVFWWSIYTL